MHHKAIALNSSDSLVALNSHSRLDAMDLQRGLMMSLMALSHCQEYSAFKRYSREYWHEPVNWLGTSLFDLFHQIFISMFVAGGFFMMMGIGIILLWKAKLKEGWSLEKTCRYLIQRGLVLILLQATVLQFFEIIAERKIYVYVGVLFALGVCMISAAIFLYVLNKIKSLNFIATSLFLIIIILLFSHIVVRDIIFNNTHPSMWQIIFLLGGDINILGFEMSIDFTPLPWFIAVLFGLILGQIFYTHKQHAIRIFGILSIALLISCFLLRLANIGEYQLFLSSENPQIFSLFCMSKYPPSLCYFLWSLGANLTFLVLFYRMQKIIPQFCLEPLRILGRSALFFFVTHWFVFYSLSLVWPKNTDSFMSLLAMWSFGMLLLCTMCMAYGRFKIKQAKNSFWRLL